MPKIVHVVGTSGAGKSYVVRGVLSTAETIEDQFVAGRQKPVGHLLWLPGLMPAVFVAGYYGDAGTGGCDTIKDVTQVFALVEEHWRQGRHVVYEGLFTMNHTRGPLLARAVGPENVHVVKLAGSLTACLARVDSRRALLGKGALAERRNAGNAMKNLGGTYKRAVNYASKMGFVGCRIHYWTSDDAALKLLKLLSEETHMPRELP